MVFNDIEGCGMGHKSYWLRRWYGIQLPQLCMSNGIQSQYAIMVPLDTTMSVPLYSDT